MKKIILYFLFFLHFYNVHAQSPNLFTISKLDVSYKLLNEGTTDSSLIVSPTIQINVSDFSLIYSLKINVSDATTQNKVFEFLYTKEDSIQASDFDLTISANTIVLVYKKSIQLKPYIYELVVKNNSDEIIYQNSDLK